MTRARNISRILSAQEISGDINLSGIVTATEFYGDGSNLTGVGLTADTSTNSLVVTGISTLGNVTAGVATANQFSGNITGTAATFSGNVTVGGVLTYDDVTNVDSLGIITARSGVSIADSIFHTGDTNTAIRFPAADTFTVETAGAETLRITSAGLVGIGTNDPATSLEVFTDDDTDINNSGGTNNTNSILRLYNKNGSDGTGVNNYTGIRFDVAYGARSSAYLNYVRTGDNQGAFLFKARNAASSYPELLRITSAGRVGINSATPDRDLEVVKDGNAFIRAKNTSSSVNIDILASSSAAFVGPQSNHDLGLQTNNVERLRITSTGGVHFNNAELIERVNIVANKLSVAPNVNLDNGMVHYFTTTETTTAIPNITTTVGINTNMATGDTMSVTIITTAATAGYSTGARIDAGATLPVLWNGGSDPSEGGDGGVDVYTYQIIKTGDAAFTVLGNVSNFA